jgi:heme-degrading monooxygenase HmoA
MKDLPISQVSTFTLFRFRGRHAFWIFGQMQKAKKKFDRVPGLLFYKLMGSGGKNGFSKILNVNTYALHCVWRSESDADEFFTGSAVFSEFATRATERYTIFMKTVKAHGLWDKRNPYSPQDVPSLGPIAVITRARIRLRYVPKFWRHVPSLGTRATQAKGSIFSIGIGEYPWFMQATFSIWESREAMQAFAYGSALHTDVIKKTRELGWYSEELFANFVPYKTLGSWKDLRLELDR